MITPYKIRRQTRKLRTGIAGLRDVLFFVHSVVVHQPAANEGMMVTALRQIEIEFGDVCIEAPRCRSCEGESSVVEAVTNSRRVRHGILLENSHDCGIGPRTEGTSPIGKPRCGSATYRIHRSQIRGLECLDVAVH